jgi:DNA-binding winged helix-turn-helix (wHTH) protein
VAPIRFGPFAFDRGRRLLLKGSDEVPLTPKAFRLLEVLLDERPNAVPRERLQKLVWGGVHVSESSLAGVVSELRAALGDARAGARYIRTVHGHGYAFRGEPAADAVADAEAALEYRLLHQRREIPLRPGENLLGRDRDAVAWLDAPGVSRRHARIRVDSGGAVLEDLGSHNGTYVGGRRVDAPVRLEDGAEIRLGSTPLTFRVFSPSDTKTEPPRR